MFLSEYANVPREDGEYLNVLYDDQAGRIATLLW